MKQAPLKVGCICVGYFGQFHYDAWERIPGGIPIASEDMEIEKARATGHLTLYGLSTLQRLSKTNALMRHLRWLQPFIHSRKPNAIRLHHEERDKQGICFKLRTAGSSPLLPSSSTLTF